MLQHYALEIIPVSFHFNVYVFFMHLNSCFYAVTRFKFVELCILFLVGWMQASSAEYKVWTYKYADSGMSYTIFHKDELIQRSHSFF